MNRTKVLLVDSQRIILEGISMLISANEKLHLAGTAENAVDALKLMELYEIDLVITDCQAPEFSGIDLCLQTRYHYPHIKTILLTMVEEKTHIRNAILAGVEGYVLKNASSEELYYAIQSVMNGNKYFCNNIITKLAREAKVYTEKFSDLLIPKVSSRELEVLRLIAQEFSTTEIADRLFISPPTAESHRRNLIRKLGVKGSIGLALYAVRHKII
jgi:DNA-binding NarL/FixJ family response regulator